MTEEINYGKVHDYNGISLVLAESNLQIPQTLHSH